MRGEGRRNEGNRVMLARRRADVEVLEDDGLPEDESAEGATAEADEDVGPAVDRFERRRVDDPRPAGDRLEAPGPLALEAGAGHAQPEDRFGAGLEALDPRDYTMEAVLDRLARHGDLFEGVLTTRQSLGEALQKLR